MFRLFKQQEVKQAPSVHRTSNRDLSLEDIPSPDAEWRIIAAFALSFDGHGASGSPAECAKLANAHRNDTLTELRTCLFFEQRRWHHYGRVPEGEDLTYIRDLIESIRTKVAASLRD